MEESPDSEDLVAGDAALDVEILHGELIKVNVPISVISAIEGKYCGE